jgi:hypothetical protein
MVIRYTGPPSPQPSSAREQERGDMHDEMVFPVAIRYLLSANIEEVIFNVETHRR